MKKIKWLTPLTTITLAATSVSFSLSSCGDSDKVPHKIEQYISDRTFSIVAVATYQYGPDEVQSAVFGTGWIVSDWTEDNANDYKYHLATNWHVTRGFENLMKDSPGYIFKSINYFYGDSNNVDTNGLVDEFYEFTTFDYSDRDDKFIFYDLGAIDLYVCDVDFNTRELDSNIKAKLDRVNKYKSQKGYINKFVDSSSKETLDKTKYIGGYPVKAIGNVSSSKWETHCLDNLKLQYKDMDTEYHYIDENDTTYYYDMSAQYAAKNSVDPSWMTHGASGSMIVTQDLEICGIYWGGQVDKADNPTKFWPRISLFKDGLIDFIFEWL